MLADFARVHDWQKFLCKSKGHALFQNGLADERNRAFYHAAAKRAEHWPVIFRLGVRNGSVWVTHDCSGDHAAFQHHGRLYAEEGWIPDTEIGKLSRFNRADIRRNALGNRGIDRVFRDIASRPEIVVVAFLLSQPTELFPHFIGSLPRTNYDFANAAHGLTIRRNDRECAQIMQNILCRYSFLADSTFSEGHILRNTSVEVMSDHNHIESLFERIRRVGPRRTCRRWNNICLATDFDNVWSMSATGPFRVKSVNGSTLEGCDSIFDKSTLVQRVSVDKHLHVHVIRDREATIDGGGSRTPVFMKFQAARSSLNLFNQTQRQARIAFAKKTKIHGECIGSLEHPLHMPGSWCTGRGCRPGRRAGPAAHHRGEA